MECGRPLPLSNTRDGDPSSAVATKAVEAYRTPRRFANQVTSVELIARRSDEAYSSIVLQSSAAYLSPSLSLPWYGGHPRLSPHSLFLAFGISPPILLGMPSFDIVSQVSSMELENALNQAKKELASRFDFRGVKAEIVFEKDEITLTAQDAFKLKALEEIVIGKLAKRQISLKNIERKEPEISSVGHGRQIIKIKQGLESSVAKQVASFVRDTKLKVTTQIQGDEVRVSGKNRDDLQEVIAAVRGHEFPADLQFINFRD
jgi:uncharacterized protein YajQ (UPF0234 family)